MTKILMTANSSWYLANFRSGLIQAMHARGYSVTILAPNDVHADRLRKLGCDVIPLAMDNKGTSPVRDWLLFIAFWRQLRRLKPDAVFSFTVKNNIYCGLAARRAKIPFLPTVSGLGTAFVKQNWLTRVVTVLSRVAFRHLPVVFFQNSDDSDLFISHGIVAERSCLHVPGSGVDLTAFAMAPLPSQDVAVMLLIARMLWDKGIAEYVEAACQLRSEGFPVRFQLLGFLGVESRTAIDEATMDGWVAEGVVEYLGATEDVRPFIRDSDWKRCLRGFTARIWPVPDIGRGVSAADVDAN